MRIVKHLLSSLLVALTLNLSIVAAQQTSPNTIPDQSAASVSRDGQETRKTTSPKLPAEISLVLEVTESPGIANPKSFWEGVYEIRVADWSAIVANTKSGGSKSELGELLVRSSFSKRAFSEKENRQMRVSVPVSGSLLKRLQQQTRTKQAFLLFSTLRVFDAQLDQNIAFELNRVWQQELFPEGEARITIRIKPDGSYSTLGPTPKVLPAGYTIVGPSGVRSPNNAAQKQ